MPTPRTPLPVLIVTALVILAYVLIAGTSERQPFYRSLSYHFYKYEAQALLGSQLALPIPPQPELLALPNPYDPAQNHPYRLQDVALYNGHYYLFHGPAPALLFFAPYQAITGQPLSHAMLNAFLCSLGFLLTLDLLRRVWRWQKVEVPTGWQLLLVIAVGFLSGTLNLLRRPEVYQVACATAYAGAMTSLWCLFRAIESPERRIRFFIGAGVAAAVCLGARPNTLFFAVVPCAVAFWLGRESNRPWRSLALTATPIVLAVALLCLHNWLRFGDPLEFGLRYQLASVDQRHATFVKLEHFPLNVWCYLSALPLLEPLPHFPYLACRLQEMCFLDEHRFHSLERLCSLFGGTPFFLLLALVPLTWSRLQANSRRALTATVAALALNLGYLLFYNSAHVRYMADFQPFAILLLCAALPVARERLRGSFLQGVLTILAVALALWSILISCIAHLQSPPSL